MEAAGNVGTTIRNLIEGNDEQTALMSELLGEMALLRCWIDGLHESDYRDPTSEHAATEKSREEIPVGREESLDHLFNSFTIIRHLIKEVQQRLTVQP